MSDFKAYIKKCEYGWIEFYINDIKIYISFAFNPLFEIKESLEKLICGCENITFEIDEEGNEKRFEFFYSKPYFYYDDRYVLKIFDDDELIFEKRLSKEKFVSEIYKTFMLYAYSDKYNEKECESFSVIDALRKLIGQDLSQYGIIKLLLDKYKDLKYFLGGLEKYLFELEKFDIDELIYLAKKENLKTKIPVSIYDENTSIETKINVILDLLYEEIYSVHYEFNLKAFYSKKIEDCFLYKTKQDLKHIDTFEIVNIGNKNVALINNIPFLLKEGFECNVNAKIINSKIDLFIKDDEVKLCNILEGDYYYFLEVDDYIFKIEKENFKVKI